MNGGGIQSAPQNAPMTNVSVECLRGTSRIDGSGRYARQQSTEYQGTMR